MEKSARLFRSFAGGVISPEMFGRLDLDKFQTGLEEAVNFIILPHGPAVNRGGTEYVNEAKDVSRRVRVIRFAYNTDQTMAVELGHNYARFHTRGATLLETAQAITSISQANPALFTKAAHGYVNDDWVYLASIGGMPSIERQFYRVTGATTNTFTLQRLDGTYLDTSALAAYSGGGTVARVYTLATPYSSDDIFDLNYTQSEDVLTLTHPGYDPRELRRLGAASWELKVVEFEPALDPPASATAAAKTGSGSVKYEYAVTAVDTAGVEESYAKTAVVSSVSITGITKANPGVITTGAVHGLVADDRCYISGIGGMTQIEDGIYKVNTAPTTTTLTLKRISTDAVVDTTNYSTWSAGGAVAKIEVTNALSTSGNANRISWPAVANAARYNVYKLRNGLYGYIGQTSNLEFLDDNIAADVARTPPEPGNANPFAGTGDKPGAVGYYSQRRLFGGTENRKQNGWMTKPGTESNLTSSVPLQDDDAIAFRIKSGENNRILHFLALTDLIILTTGVEWRLVTQNSDALTPTSFDIKPQSYVGASKVRPVLTSRSALFMQSDNKRLREMSYNWEQNQYSAADISLMAPHLFDKYTITDMAYQTSPYQIAWLTRSDGTLLGLTYVPEHKVSGWHEHRTAGGVFESVCTVREDGEDRVYAVVKRTVNGRDVRYIERFASRNFATVADSHFVDCGLRYAGPPKATFTGLWHLEGKQVSALSDGAVVGALTVTNGQVTLPKAAAKVSIGLPIRADLKTLPLIVEAAAALGFGSLKSIAKAYLRLQETPTIKVGPSYEKLTPLKARSNEPYDSPPRPRTGVVGIAVAATWSHDAPLCVRHDDPTPLTLSALAVVAANA